MQTSGLKVSQIVNHLGINRRRIDKWVRLDTFPERSRMQQRPGMAESFRDYLRHRWDAGIRHGRTLFAENRNLATLVASPTSPSCYQPGVSPLKRPQQGYRSQRYARQY